VRPDFSYPISEPHCFLSSQVFEAVCSLVHQTHVERRRFSEALESFLLEQARSYVRQAVSTYSPLTILDSIRACFPTRIPPAQVCLRRRPTPGAQRLSVLPVLFPLRRVSFAGILAHRKILVCPAEDLDYVPANE
jgi:hypothetical protein